MIIATSKMIPYVFYVLIALTLIPVIAFIGSITTKDGLEILRRNPFMIIYYLVFWTFAYFFWFDPIQIVDYLKIARTHQLLLYGAMCLIPILERGLPN